jgi:hypothetical protein
VRLPWPDGILARSLVALCLALSVAALLAFLLYERSRAEAIFAFEAARAADRVADQVLLSGLPGSHRALPAEPLGVVLRVEPAPGVPAEVPGGFAMLAAQGIAARLPWVAELRARLDDSIPAPEAGRVFGRAEQMALLKRRTPPPRVLHVALRLPDGSWANAEARAFTDSPAALWEPRFLAAFGLLAAATALILAWVVAAATRPLREVARAAERLGEDLNAPHLPARGAREARATAQAFNRMQDRLRDFVAGRTRMLAAISHDLRTPLTRARLRAEALQPEAERVALLADLARMEAMLATTLAFARGDVAREERRLLDLAVLLGDIAEERAEAGEPVRHAGPERGAVVLAAPSALRRALENLVANAVIHGGGATLGLASEPVSWRVTVEDDGPGLPEAKLETVFEAFRRGDAARGADGGGSGLGLAIVRDVAAAHGGRAWLENRPGGGLRAVLLLPAAGAVTPPARRP